MVRKKTPPWKGLSGCGKTKKTITRLENTKYTPSSVFVEQKVGVVVRSELFIERIWT